MSNNIAILGATGFVGKYLLNDCLISQKKIRFLTRGETKIRGAEAFVGNVNSAQTILEPFLDGISTIFNCAGELNCLPIMRKTHVEGTNNLLKTLDSLYKKNQQPIHWIQLSSCGAYGQLEQSSLPRTVSESTIESPLNEYEITKTEADNLIIAFAHKNLWFKYTIIRPTNIFGVGMSSRAILNIAHLVRKKLFFYIKDKNAIVNFIDVCDVVNVMQISANNPNAYNQIYIISNDCKFQFFVNFIADFYRVAKPKVIVPEDLLRKIIFILSYLIKLPVNQAHIDVMTRRTNYCNHKAINELAWTPGVLAAQIEAYLKNSSQKT